MKQLSCLTTYPDLVAYTTTISMKDCNFQLQISSKFLETDTSSFAHSFYEVKGRAARRVSGVGLPENQDLSMFVCF